MLTVWGRSRFDFRAAVIDEIALEGLDGITIEGLWKRLTERPHFTFPLDDYGKRFLWNIVKESGQIDFYKLPVPRHSLVVFNRYDYVDPDIGLVLEPDDKPIDVYPHYLVNDADKNIKGSSQYYKERENITDTIIHGALSLEEVQQRWDMTLVLVASQSMRELALMGCNADPLINMAPTRYCILERIGRARYLGEVTQGKMSLQVVGEDAKTLFYHRKFLASNGLVTKQVHHQKHGKLNCSGSLLHLPRFYIERKSKTLILTHRVVKILKDRPNYMADYEEIRKELGVPNMLKKLFKTPEFQRFIKTDLRLPYRALYPTASIKEWRHKGKDKEKTIRAIQLIDPELDENEIWVKDDEADQDQELPTDVQPIDLVYDRSLLHQAFYVVDKAGTEGLSQVGLSAAMGVTRLQSRSICRNLLKLNVVSTYLDDVGRQRVARYMSKRYVKQSKIAIEFNTEKEKLFDLIENAKKNKLAVKLENSRKNKKRGKEKKKKPEVKISKLEVKAFNTDGNEQQEGRLEEQTGIGMDNRKDTFSIDTVDLNPRKKIKVNTENDDGISKHSTSELESATSQLHTIGTEICRVKESGPGIMEELQRMPHTKKEAPAITYRILRRANYIIHAVQCNKVIDDLTKLMKLINEEEEKEGLTTKMDKKSLIRLLLKLNKDSHIKFIKITLKAGDKEKILNFVCDLSITQDHPIIQSAIEQHKLKFFLVPKDKLPKPRPVSPVDIKTEQLHKSLCNDLIVRSAEELKAMSPKQKMNTFVYNRKAGKKYGFSPKFIRLRTLHQFLFYIIYGYAGVEGLDQAEAVAEFRAKGAEITAEDVADMPTIYLKELSWKTFIPPLPHHSGWPEGWSIICDILLRLPLSIFVRIINVTYNVPQLEAYLNHPARRHYLIKSLPAHMRNNLMVARKYIFSFHEIVQRLCFMGLAQFGPQRLKDKEQVFMYLNRRTSLLDTTTSRPGYHQVSEDIKYTKHEYEFNTYHDVDKYWYEVWNICLHTQLGARLCMSGQDIILEVLVNKTAMVEAVQPRSPEEAPLLDTGEVPGDHRGAAGLDSAIFSHLKRNWNWTNAHTTTLSFDADIRLTVPQPENQRMARIASLMPQPVRFDEFLGSQAMKGSTQAPVVSKNTIGHTKATHMKHFSTVKTPKPIAVRRRILPRKKSKIPRRPFYDEVDKKAQKSMTRWRVQWSEEEDNVLLLCKVAMMFICPNPRRQIISFTVVRDVLHKSLTGSCNKTSRACQRRVTYMMKNSNTAHSISLHLEEIKQDEYIVTNFENTLQEARAQTDGFEELDKTVCERFKTLVTVLQKKFSKINLIRNIPHEKFRSSIPDTINELRLKYEVLNPTSLKFKGKFQDVKNVVDICCATVNAIVHSTLCCITDKRSYMYQLFKIYQQYPDNLLRSVMAKIRTDQMVSARKAYARVLHRTGNYLPVSSLPYQLSITYFYLLQTKYHFEVFHECHLMKQMILDHHKTIIEDAPNDNTTKEVSKPLKQDYSSDRGMECVTVDGGAAACLVEWYLRGNLTLNLQIPENIVILDPRVEKKDDAYKKILDRYQEIMRSCKITSSLPATSSLFTTPFFVNNPSDPSLARMDFEVGQPQAEQRIPVVTDPSAVPGSSSEPDVPINLSTSQQPAVSNDTSVPKKCLFKLDRETIRRCVPKTPGEEWSDSDESSEDEVEADAPSVPVSPSTQYVIARAASRIALFLMRDSLSSTTVGEKQHAHDFFVVNACQVYAKLHESKTSEEALVSFQGFQYRNDTGNYVPTLEQLHSTAGVRGNTRHSTGSLNKAELLPILPEQTKQVLDHVESNLLVPEKLVTDEEAHEIFEEAGASEKDWEQACLIVHWLQIKKEVGATVKELREKFSYLTCDGSLARILDLLTESKILLRAGVTTVHYVHHQHRKPWLLHSYRLLRQVRERLMTQKTVVLTQRSKKRARLTKNYAEALFGGNGGLHPVKKRAKRSRSMEALLTPKQLQEGTEIEGAVPSIPIEVDHPQGESAMQDVPHLGKDHLPVPEVIECENQENSDTISEHQGESGRNVAVKPESADGQKIAARIQCDDNTDLVEEQPNKDSPDVATDSVAEASCETEVPDVPVENTSDVLHESALDFDNDVPGQKKVVDLDQVVQEVDWSDTEMVHVAVRPWVRVDGTLNRRVLDRMLGSVLGQCLCQPGASVEQTMDRFSPALQPFQTRQLLEILQKLGCVKLKVVKKGWKTNLFSKVAPVWFEEADGTEDESHIIVCPAVDAIMRLGTFIGNKAYKKDFLS